MYLHDGRVHLDGLNLDVDDLFFLQTLEYLVQNAVLRPTVHARINGVPRAESLGQSAPLASLFSNVEQSIEKLQVRYLHVAPLTRQLRLDPLILGLGDLHFPTLSQ